MNDEKKNWKDNLRSKSDQNDNIKDYEKLNNLIKKSFSIISGSKEIIDNIKETFKNKTSDILNITKSINPFEYDQRKDLIIKENDGNKEKFYSGFSESLEKFSQLIIRKEPQSIDKKEDDNNEKRFYSGFLESLKENFFPPIVIGIKDSLEKGFVNAFNIINSSIEEIVGPEISKLMDFVKSILSSTVNIFKSVFSGFFNLSKNNVTEKIKDDVGKILNIFKRREKKEQIESPEKSIWQKIKDVILGPLLIIGVILGGIVSKFMIPFTILSKTIQALSKIKIVGKIFSTFSVFREILKPLDKLIDFAKQFGKIGKYFPTLFKKGFLLGFKAFTRFFQPIISVIQFIKGFISEEGTIIDKIKNGLMFVVKDLIELPARLVGWISDNILNFLGMEVSEGGTGALIIENVMSNFKGFLDLITNTFSSISNLIKKNKEPIVNTIIFLRGHFTDLFNLMKDIFSDIGNIIKNTLELVFNIFTGGDWITPLTNIGNILLDTWGKIFNFFKEKIIGAFDFLIEDFVKPLLEKIGFNEKIDNIKNSIKNTVNSFLGIFDSIKNYFINIKNEIIDWFKNSKIGHFLLKDDELNNIDQLYNPIIGSTSIDEKDQDVEKIEKEKREKELRLQAEREKRESKQKTLNHIVSNSGNIYNNNYNIKGTNEISIISHAFNY